MDNWRNEWVASHLERSITLLREVQSDSRLCEATVTAAKAIVETFQKGGKLLIAGNGGSAADAQHIAGEFLSRLNFDRAPLAALAITTDTSVLTAIGNDYGYTETFARQVLGLGREGDALIVISTSGRSPNVLSALSAGRLKGTYNIVLTGAFTQEVEANADLVLSVPSQDTPLIQQVHTTLAHVICGIVERAIFKPQ